MVTPRFRKRHDLLHQGILSILSVWHVSTVCQSPCLSSAGFLHGSDQGSYTAFRYQSQRTIHLHAALQVCIAQRSHGCQRDRVSLDFESVHHLVRNRTDEAHVYSEAESKVLVLCIVSIKRRRLAQASQVLEQLCIQRFGGHTVASLIFDPCACTSQDEYCTTELFLSVDTQKKKNNQQGRQRQGRDGVSVQMSMSM